MNTKNYTEEQMNAATSFANKCGCDTVEYAFEFKSFKVFIISRKIDKDTCCGSPVFVLVDKNNKIHSDEDYFLELIYKWTSVD